jgi:hypothetical protein
MISMTDLPSDPGCRPKASPLRLALVSTPRSGNTWLRHLLKAIYQLDRPGEELAVHRPDDVPWTTLPPRCVLQLHWHFGEPFRSLLEEHQFRVVTLARHPIDVLISVLRYASNETETWRWLDGEGGDEESIVDVTPRDPAFLDYAISPRASALLSVSRGWWRAPGCHRLRYEDLVADPPSTLKRLCNAIGEVPLERIRQATRDNTLNCLRSRGHRLHVWKGYPGLWRILLTGPEAERIAEHHADVFRELGYTCDSELALEEELVDANWQALR